MVSPRNDVWEKNAEIACWRRVTNQIWIVLLIGRAARSWNSLQQIRSTTQILVVTRHPYGISALVPRKSFRRETSGGVVKCRLFSQTSTYHASSYLPSKRHEVRWIKRLTVLIAFIIFLTIGSIVFLFRLREDFIGYLHFYFLQITLVALFRAGGKCSVLVHYDHFVIILSTSLQ